MPSADGDPRIASVKPRITYNTIGGVNGPLVILDNVRSSLQRCKLAVATADTGSHSGQIPQI